MTAIYTARDAIEHLRDYLGGNAEDATMREIRRAVVAANRELAAAHRWSCRYKIGHLNIKEPLTGTLSYTHSSRTFTTSVSTDSSWAAEGTLRIGSDDYPVFRRTGATTLIADASINPGEDIASGTSFTLYRDAWTLPADFLAVGMIYPTNTGSSFIAPDAQFNTRRLAGGGGSPLEFTVVADRKRPGRMAFHLSPWPSADDTIQYLYQSEARALKYSGFAQRDIQGTCTLSSTTVTGVGTAFESGMVGSIIRLSDPSAGARAADVPGDDASDNPAYYEGVIVAVDSTTSLTVLENTDSLSVSSAVGYCISDPVDWSTNLLNAFMRCCEKQSEIVRQREEGSSKAIALYAQALADAKVADRRSFESMSLGENWQQRLKDAWQNVGFTTE